MSIAKEKRERCTPPLTHQYDVLDNTPLVDTRVSGNLLSTNALATPDVVIPDGS